MTRNTTCRIEIVLEFILWILKKLFYFVKLYNCQPFAASLSVTIIASLVVSVSRNIKLYYSISYQISCLWCLGVYMNFLDCTNVDSFLPLELYPLTCHLDNTCTKVSCCVDSPVINSTFEVVMDVDPCNRMLYLEIENLKIRIPFNEIKWGKINV